MILIAEASVVVPIITGLIAAAFGALATVLAAVIPAWLKLRSERASHEMDVRKSRKEQGSLEADVDQLQDQLSASQQNVIELTNKVAQLRAELVESRKENANIRQQHTQPNQGVAEKPITSPLKPPTPTSFTARLPVPSATFGSNSQQGRDKRAYLVGLQPGKRSVQWLVKVHDYKGKAIYVYDLLSREWHKEADANTPDIDERIREYGRVGHQIEHPGDIRLNKADEWIAHALKEAKRLRLTVETQPQA